MVFSGEACTSGRHGEGVSVKLLGKKNSKIYPEPAIASNARAAISRQRELPHGRGASRFACEKFRQGRGALSGRIEQGFRSIWLKTSTGKGKSRLRRKAPPDRRLYRGRRTALWADAQQRTTRKTWVKRLFHGSALATQEEDAANADLRQRADLYRHFSQAFSRSLPNGFVSFVLAGFSLLAVGPSYSAGGKPARRPGCEIRETWRLKGLSWRASSLGLGPVRSSESQPSQRFD